jgi:mono/diheme cytochrome c family protein
MAIHFAGGIEMFRRTRVELLCVAILPLGIVLALNDAPLAAEAPGASAGPVSFARQVLPIFQASCSDCHGAETKEVELSLITYADVMKGSEYGTVIEAGDPSGSLLLDMVSAGEMPQDAPALGAEEIALIRSWIQQGAQNN